MEFLEIRGFREAIRALGQQGMYTKAVDEVWAIYGRIAAGVTGDEIFGTAAVTHHGETRIPNCIKFDLPGRARLVTVRTGGVWLFLHVGTHDDVDKWLDRHRGLDFVAKQRGGSITVSTIRASGKDFLDVGGQAIDFSDGPLLSRLSERHRSKMLEGMSPGLVAEVEAADAMISDEDLQDLALQCGESARVTLVHDVLHHLRAGDVISAKTLIARFTNEVKPVGELKPEEVATIRSGDNAVLVKDVERLFRHFLDTATFEQWMLYLHEAQREHVERDHSGAARLTGVSGSGKTCVVVHRGIRLAAKYPDEPVLILTLSQPLAALIDRLIDAATGKKRPSNLRVSSVWELCYGKLIELEPHRSAYYTRQTITPNAFAVSEGVDDIWHEYYECGTNNHDADVLFDVIRTLNVRGVFGRDYLRQEFDYLRSALAPEQREDYVSLERVGRVEPLTAPFRKLVAIGLEGWERKMEAVGVIDDLGIAGALYRHLPKLLPEFRCVLVDEVQDLGTVELSIIRKLTKEGENDLFLCGDGAQSIYTKHTDLKASGINIVGRSTSLSQNYRNSRQILEAAHAVLTKGLEALPQGSANVVEALPPEFANFSTTRPMLMHEASIAQELANAATWLRESAEQDLSGNQRACIAICGYARTAVAEIARQLRLPALSEGADLASAPVFVSDLEHTKGFEFDTMVIVNCALGAIPHPALPAGESYRDLCRLYVAMTRAKKHLIVSYSGRVSPFIERARDLFIESTFAEHGVDAAADATSIKLPAPSVPQQRAQEAWALSGKAFLRSRDAVGMSDVLQTEILDHVTGRVLQRGQTHKQLEWKTFGAFVRDMKNPQSRHQILSPEAVEALDDHLAALSGGAEAATSARGPTDRGSDPEESVAGIAK